MANPTMTPLSMKQVLEEAASQFLKTHGYDLPGTGKGNGKANGKAKPSKAEAKATPKGNKPDPAIFEAEVIRAFKKAGFDKVTPRVDVLTYNRWLGAGFKVKAGEKSVKVKQFRLFHKSQVEPLNAPTPALPPKTSKGKAAIKAAKATA